MEGGRSKDTGQDEHRRPPAGVLQQQAAEGDARRHADAEQRHHRGDGTAALLDDVETLKALGDPPPRPRSSANASPG
ncbi:hypothetical protein [Streptosporangium fragile]|uniref:hypothetical protein n=1 Tax=Streptosporangium fragile TaxID=46186 RepID=UPI0031F0D621